MLLLLLLCPKSPFVSFGIGVADEDDCVDSSMAARTLRNFDSDFLDIWLCVVMEPGGCEFRLASLEVGDTEGEGAVLIGGDIERGGVVEEEAGTSAQAALDSKKPPVVGVQEFCPETMPSLLVSSSVAVDVIGLGLDDGTLAMTASGGRIENILSSAGGGPYASNGSGTA